MRGKISLELEQMAGLDLIKGLGTEPRKKEAGNRAVL